MINSITIEGRLTKDIELKEFGNTKVINNTIAVYGGKDSNENELTFFFDFKAFNFVAEQLSKNARKGARIVLNGALKQDKWEKDNEKFSKVMIYVDSVEIMSGSTEENTPQNVKDKVKEVAEKLTNDLPY